MGRITDLTPGPGRATTVTVVLDRDVRVPRDVRAAVSSKSAIGEGFIQLTPQTAGEPYLAAGDVIPLSRTDSQVKLERLLGNLDSLAASIPLDDLATVLREADAYEAAGRAKTAARTRKVAVEHLGRALTAAGAPGDEQLRELLEQGKPLTSDRAFGGADAAKAGTATPSKSTDRGPLPGRISDPRPATPGQKKGRDGPGR